MMSNLGNSAKQRDIFKRELEILTNDRAVSGVLLTGSVACGCTAENSDVDIIALCDRHCFETHFTDGILVETSFKTYEYAVEKLNAEPMDVYHYLDAEIAFDRDGRLSEIMALAKQKYENYRTPQKVRDSLYHWLMTVKIKIEAADELKKRYLAHINAWKILEAVWAVNNKPMPPAGTAYRKRGELQTVPCENWFEKLFSEDCCGAAAEIIDFLLPILKDGDVYGRKKKAKKVHTKIPSETAEIIDGIESLKYRAAALMKLDNAEITPDMTNAEILAVMDKYLYLAEKKLAEELRIKTEQNVMSEILRLQREIDDLRQNLEELNK